MVPCLAELAAKKPLRIMIVEDEGIIASHIVSRLTRTGYEVAGIAESSEEAIAKISELNPALILMDIRIKGAMDGIDTAIILRERCDIPVIYLSAHTDQQTLDRAKMTGAFGFLTKPIHHASLATAIDFAIHKHGSDRAARQQRAWMATVLGTMADAMVVIDHERKVQYLNRPAEGLTGWTNADARGLDVALVLRLTESATGVLVNQKLFQPVKPQPPSQLPRGLMLGASTGRRFPIEGEMAVSLDGDKVVGAVITFRDATIRQAQENELRHQLKMQAVGRLAAGIAHDFHNLLFIILGYADEMILGGRLQEKELLALAEIKKAGENATKITQQLLTFSRKERAGKQDINLNETIRDTEELFRRLGGPTVRWQFKLSPDLAAVRADPEQVKQILMNLVANAGDAMPNGGRITIETTNADLQRTGPRGKVAESFVALSVTDTGTGMSAEAAEHLFEPFFTTKPRSRGTGLGLSIVHSIVSDLGGKIRVHSEPDSGAAFTIYLPRIAADAQAPNVEVLANVAVPVSATV
jgi:two-component system cell cycle sensor histidine kinase/response regulator CckA